MDKKRKKKQRKRPIYKDDPNVFAVDRILEKRTNGEKTEYFIKWVGYPDSANEWIDESNITEDVIEEFNLKEKSLTKESVEPVASNNEETVSVLEEDQRDGTYFEENFHNLGCNVQLQATLEEDHYDDSLFEENSLNLGCSLQLQSTLKEDQQDNSHFERQIQFTREYYQTFFPDQSIEASSLSK